MHVFIAFRAVGLAQGRAHDVVGPTDRFGGRMVVVLAGGTGEFPIDDGLVRSLYQWKRKKGPLRVHVQLSPSVLQLLQEFPVPGRCGAHCDRERRRPWGRGRSAEAPLEAVQARLERSDPVQGRVGLAASSLQ